MRGGLTYSEAINTSHSERMIIKEIIEHNMEITKETKMPFF